MKTAPVAEIQASFGAYLRASEKGPVVVTRDGRAVAVLLAIADDEELERLAMAYSPKLQGLLETSRQQIQEGRGIPHEDFWQEVEAGAT